MENGMGSVAKLLIGAGLVLVFLGLLFWFFGKYPGFRNIPGDMVFKREDFTFYFPLGTSILISILLTLLIYLWRKFGG